MKFSDESELNKFIEKFSGCQSTLRNLCNEEKERISREIEHETNQFEKEKENLVSEAKEIFHNTLKFKGSNLPESKYKLVLLTTTDVDFIFLKEAIDSGLESIINIEDIVLKIHRVVSTDNTETECKNLTGSNLLHGTNGQNVEGILKEGFNPSQSGRKGSGIYLTNSFEMAAFYGKCYENEEDNLKRMVYLFVNKVKQSHGSKSPMNSREDYDGKRLSKMKISFAKLNQSFKRKVLLTESSKISKLCDEYRSNEPKSV